MHQKCCPLYKVSHFNLIKSNVFSNSESFGGEGKIEEKSRCALIELSESGEQAKHILR